MKQIVFFFFIIISGSIVAQNKGSSYVDVTNFKGNIALHNRDILHLIQGHPSGVIVSWNKKTFGEKEWQKYYNYPDYGISFVYQDMISDILGDNYSVLGHYNFYLLKRNLMFRVASGLAYNKNPFDRIENPKNIAFGTTFLSTSYIMLNYKKERLVDRLGFQTGLSIVHYSNTNIKAPNTSTNTIALNLGFLYNLEKEDPKYIEPGSKEKFKEPIKLNLAFSGGVNTSDLIGTPQFPFYVFSIYADKRVNRKSAIQVGTDTFVSWFLKEYIRFRAIAFDDDDLADADFKRGGVFVGHELFLNKLSIITQVGYYTYYPFDFEGRAYFRVGAKRYITDKWFTSLHVKTHAGKAESGALGIGIRL